MKFGVKAYTIRLLLHAKFSHDQLQWWVGLQEPSIFPKLVQVAVFRPEGRQYAPIGVKFGVKEHVIRL